MDNGFLITICSNANHYFNIYVHKSILTIICYFNSGLDSFKGWVTHSHEYRVPEPFTNKRVLIVGASYSAQDISIPVSAVAKEVVISHNKNRIQFLSPGVRQMKGVQSVTET